MKEKISAAAYADTKPHYEVLNGFRGVAALMVVWYHIFESFATSQLDQVINHGYLAVDFFFILSGFVIAYAYDDRFGMGGMSALAFIKRRIIRLHPMVILGAVLGGLLFYTQGCEFWEVSRIAVGTFLVSLLLHLFLLPVVPGSPYEVRGIGEMFPLNGPAWSLFYEYVGNLLYVLILRKLPTILLSVFVGLMGVLLFWQSVYGVLGGVGFGFALNEEGILGGPLRLLFSFSAGLLLARFMRVHKGFSLSYAFLVGSLLIVLICALPRITMDAPVESTFSWNGLYEALCVLFVFPFIVNIGANERIENPFLLRICRFLGDISYPLYIVHYPFLYLYFAWVKNNEHTFISSIHGALALYFGCIVLAYISLKVYDIPVRKWLTNKWLR